jgi:hypothetical protein
MLKVTAIQDGGPDLRLFRLQEDDLAAPRESLERVARLGDYLLRENELPGSFRVFGEGLLALDVLAVHRTFFHDGIVFAALDAYNHPEKNPTITRMALPEA